MDPKLSSDLGLYKINYYQSYEHSWIYWQMSLLKCVFLRLFSYWKTLNMCRCLVKLITDALELVRYPVLCVLIFVLCLFNHEHALILILHSA